MTDSETLTGEALAALARKLCGNESIEDEELEKVYPAAFREASQCFWTPASVAQRVAELLVTRGPATRILDVGSGVGKVCIVGALATGASFVGVERREHFVITAIEAATKLGADTTRFVHGPFDEQDILSFDGVYMFNPFEENLWGPTDWLDDTVELSEPRFQEDVLRAESWLSAARPGTRVVTYHGFGGKFPSDYRLEVREWRRGGFLDAWIKV